jgi:hypothetical protein
MGFFFSLPICRNGLLVSFAMSFLSCPYPEMGSNKKIQWSFFIPTRYAETGCSAQRGYYWIGLCCLGVAEKKCYGQ